MQTVYQRLADPTPADLAQLCEIYEANFPPAERKPFETIQPLIAAGPYVCMAIRAADESIAAFALLLPLASTGTVFLEYLAVSQSAQGQGLGSALLKETASYLAKEGIARGLVWEVEPPLPEALEAPQNRRIRFYEKLGAALIAHSAHYRMPDYATASPSGIPLRLMQLPAYPQPGLAEVNQTITAIYRAAYPDSNALLKVILEELKADSLG